MSDVLTPSLPEKKRRRVGPAGINLDGQLVELEVGLAQHLGQRDDELPLAGQVAAPEELGVEGAVGVEAHQLGDGGDDHGRGGAEHVHAELGLVRDLERHVLLGALLARV